MIQSTRIRGVLAPVVTAGAAGMRATSMGSSRDAEWS